MYVFKCEVRILRYQYLQGPSSLVLTSVSQFRWPHCIMERECSDYRYSLKFRQSSNDQMDGAGPKRNLDSCSLMELLSISAIPGTSNLKMPLSTCKNTSRLDAPLISSRYDERDRKKSRHRSYPGFTSANFISLFCNFADFLAALPICCGYAYMIYTTIVVLLAFYFSRNHDGHRK